MVLTFQDPCYGFVDYVVASLHGTESFQWLQLACYNSISSRQHAESWLFLGKT
jgi:hypothetical protein